MNMSEALTKAFQTVGKEYGYDSVSAEFMESKEFKIKWKRSCGWAEFMVSDYLRNADQDVIEGIARTIFSRISGRKMESQKTMEEWLTNDEFSKMNRPTYLRRSRNLTKSAKGKVRDLTESYNRLVEQNIIPQMDDVAFTWTKEPNIRRIGYCSILMKVIAISSIFDTETIPEFVLDYVVYHEMLHMMRGFDPFGKLHDAEFQKEERKYPLMKESEEWLKRLRLHL
jgi:predicted metal-dependent hydrolase